MAFFVGLQRSLDRLSETQYEEPSIVITALTLLAPSEITILQEYLCLRETGLDQDTAYMFMDGRHEQAQKAMVRLQKEYSKQEQALKSERQKPAKP